MREDRTDRNVKSKGHLITAMLKDLHDADLFIATTTKLSDDDDTPDTFSTIRWMYDNEVSEEIIIKHLAYLFSEPWITDQMILSAHLLSIQLREGGSNE